MRRSSLHLCWYTRKPRRSRKPWCPRKPWRSSSTKLFPKRFDGFICKFVLFHLMFLMMFPMRSGGVTCVPFFFASFIAFSIIDRIAGSSASNSFVCCLCDVRHLILSIQLFPFDHLCFFGQCLSKHLVPLPHGHEWSCSSREHDTRKRNDEKRLDIGS